MIRYIAVALLIFIPLEGIAQNGTIYPVLRQTSRGFVQRLPVLSVPPKKSGQSFNILAIRVDFQEDTNPLTTGDGTFDYSSDSEASIDPPPHDRSYFLDHLEALKRYYDRVSDGKTEITYELFPLGDRDSYTLPHEIGYYNPNTTEEQLDILLSELLEDAVELADTDPAIDFSQYNAVIIFHAGVGSDFALESPALDPTPSDLPSVYLDLKHLRKTIGNNLPDYQGIPVDGASAFVTSAVILPETESKRNVEIGLNGIAAHQFGHYLGLPSLFNTAAGRPAIGKWGLMGVGFANLNGVIPAEPCAWSKVFLGWEIPEEVYTGVNLPVVPPEASNGTKIYKIPLSPAEYFLIENRQQDFSGDSLQVVRGASGVVIEVDDYDVDIPGSGLLIWHIDERAIAAGFAENAVNINPDRRGVDLEEADGSQDIGEVFPGLLPGVLSPENGLPWDAFYTGNNSEFTPVTVPNSWSNSRANSHISITNISDIGSIMTFSVERDSYNEGFPMYLGGDFTGMPPLYCAQSDPDSIKLIIANRSGSIFALNGYNTPFLENSATAVQYFPLGDSAVVSVPLFAETGSAIAAVPAISEDPANIAGSNKLVVATDESMIMVYSLTDSDGDLYGNLMTEWSVPARVTSPVMILSSIIVGGEDGKVRYYGYDGTLEYETPAGAGAVTGLNGIQLSGNQMVFVTYSNGEYSLIINKESTVMSNLDFSDPFNPLYTIIYYSNPIAQGLNGEIPDKPVSAFAAAGSGGDIYIKQDLNTFTNNLGVSILFSPVAGDINGDSFREIVMVSGSKIFAIENNGVLVTGFPLDILTLGYNGIITTEPILGDITGDGKQDILFGTSGGNIFALTGQGYIISGFPLPLSGGAVGSLTLLKKGNFSDRLELAVLDKEGYLYLWDLETAYSDKTIAWGTFGAGNAHLRFNKNELGSAADPPSDQLMPKGRVYNWPNPNEENWTNIRYFLYYAAEVTIRIYTQIGDLVTEIKGPGRAQVDNEVTWDLSGIESGIYLAEVTAAGNGRTEKKIIKIAVIK